MPNRIIKESICTSDNIDHLTPFQETVFIRLMVNCDDFGRFDGRAKVLSSRLFPLKNIPVSEMEDAIKAMQEADLVDVYTVGDRPYIHMKTWGKHQTTRAKKSKFPAPDEGICKQLQADDNNCMQMQADDSKCLRNRIRESINDNRYSESLSEEDADKIQQDHDRILEAAEDAGFKMSNNVRASLIALYADNGLEKVLSGLRSCSEHGAPTLAYLRACMRDEPKKVITAKPAVTAQAYTQRSYDGEQEDAMRRMLRAVT